MNTANGHPAIYWTVKKIFESIPDANVIVIAPAFDKGGSLEFLRKEIGERGFDIQYSNDASPLKRMVAATSDLSADEYVVRVDGLHIWVDLDASKRMVDAARRGLDCVKFPDDFPVQFASEVYRVGALSAMDKHLASIPESEAQRFHVHPKYLFMREKKFKTEYLKDTPRYTDDYQRECRATAKQIYYRPRNEVNSQRILAGDQMTYHYEFATKYLKSTDRVLDIASGVGFGGAYVAPFVKTVTCADLDQQALDEGKKRFANVKNLDFSEQDVTKLTLKDDQFDVILSMETIEHVPDHECLKEFRRVLKPGGKLILSTPQNSIGRIPVNAQHLREYSLQELRVLMSTYFEVLEVIGLKAGTIHWSDDPLGSNTMVIATNR
jgi:2-polyprenyl-3-methyl-5-hydroxy-6-metoxy-1,4-benzoquinol methylase